MPFTAGLLPGRYREGGIIDRRKGAAGNGAACAKDREYDPWRVFLLVATGVFMCTLDSSIVNIALPVIMKELDSTLSVVQWVVAVYLLTVSSLLLSFGRLSDIRGRRRVASVGFLLFSAGSLCCGMAGSAGALIASRSFQGVGAAMIMACSPALIVDAFPVSMRGRALGLIGAVVASGLTAGPALGGILLHWFSWRAIFYINVPIGLLGAFSAASLLKGGRADAVSGEPFDLPGAVLLTVCLGAFLLALMQGGAWGYSSLPGIALLLLFLASLTALVRVERKVSHPVMAVSLFTIRLFSLPILSAVLLFSALFVMVFLMPFYLMMPCALSPREAGFMMMVPFGFLFIVSPLSGWLSDRIGSRLLCTLGLSLLMVALFLLAGITTASSSAAVAVRLALAGIGVALFISPNSAAAMGAVPARHRGLASGMVATARNLGMVSGVALAGAIFNGSFRAGSGGLPLSAYGPEMETLFMASFRLAMMAGGVVAALGTAASFLRGRERPVESGVRAPERTDGSGSQGRTDGSGSQGRKRPE